MMRIFITTMLVIPILIFAFSYNVSYSNGYLTLKFFDATSTVAISVDNTQLFKTSLNEVSFFVGKKDFNLSLEYKGRIYSTLVGRKPYCKLTELSTSSTSITYNILFPKPMHSIPNITVYSHKIQIFFSYKRVSKSSVNLTIPISNNLDYLEFYVSGYKILYDGSITNIVPTYAKQLKLDLYAYTDFNGPKYWITVALKVPNYFVNLPKVFIDSHNITKYFTNKNGYVFGTYIYHRGSLEEGEHYLEFKIGPYVKRYRFFIYKSIAFFPDIHKQISATIYKVYTVKPGDTLYYIAVNNGTDVQSLIKINNLENGDNIKAGQNILIGKVRFAPSPDTIVISLGDSRLYFFHNRKLVGSFFASPGVKNKTPVGRFQIIRKIKNPTLYWEGEKIPPLSPINGLGTRFLQLSDPQYGIHGTTKPWEIGRRVSHGCIRMMNNDVEKIFNLVQVGTNVFITKYFSPRGRIFELNNIN